MQFISWRFILNRIKAIGSLLRDKNVRWTKKALVIFGIVYLFLPVDLIPPVIFPFGFLDDIVLWIFIIWHLKDILDTYWMGEKTVDLSAKYRRSNIVDDVSYVVDGENYQTQNKENQ